MPADVIDYQIIGDDLQGVIITLDPGEAVVAEAGAFMYMQDGIRMATTLDTTTIELELPPGMLPLAASCAASAPTAVGGLGVGWRSI